MSPRPRIRVLVVEDSPTQRQLLVSILAADPELEVVGEAGDGRQALELAIRLKPSVITMDVAMPRLGGLEATKRIMQQAPTPIVICSNLDTAAVVASMHALDAGALTALRKPPGPASPRFAAEAAELVRQVKLMARVKVVGHRRTGTTTPPPLGRARPRPSVQVIAMAASTGGPPALQHILARLPAGFPRPILVVQHIAPDFVDGLRTWLDQLVPAEVKLATDGEPLRPGRVYLAPDGGHLCLADATTIRIDRGPPIDGFRPSSTALFASLARILGGAALGVVLTGMGRDGAAGLVELQAAGGRVLAQDEASSVVFGMAAVAISRGIVDHVLPPAGIAALLVELVRSERGGEG
jgi:two-component system, chemotaxis family, protein-glutamate methylesterase/glutaminase